MVHCIIISFNFADAVFVHNIFQIQPLQYADEYAGYGQHFRYIYNNLVRGTWKPHVAAVVQFFLFCLWLQCFAGKLTTLAVIEARPI